MTPLSSFSTQITNHKNNNPFTEIIIKKFIQSHEFPKDARDLITVLQWLNSLAGREKILPQTTYDQYVLKGVFEVIHHLGQTATQENIVQQFTKLLLDLSVVTQQELTTAAMTAGRLSDAKNTLTAVLHKKFSSNPQNSSNRQQNLSSTDIGIESFLDSLSSEFQFLEIAEHPSNDNDALPTTVTNNGVDQDAVTPSANGMHIDQWNEETSQIDYEIKQSRLSGNWERESRAYSFKQREFKSLQSMNREMRMNLLENKREARRQEQFSRNRAMDS